MIKIEKLYKTYSRTKKDKKREGKGVQNVKSCSILLIMSDGQVHNSKAFPSLKFVEIFPYFMQKSFYS